MRTFSQATACVLLSSGALALAFGPAPRNAATTALSPWASAGAAPGALDDDEVLDLSLQKLADIEYEPGDEIDKEIRAYNGRTVNISGFMRTGTTEGAKWFDLTNDSCGCGTSKLQHFVRVTLENDTTRFQPNELTLTGTFSVGEKEDEDGFVESIYRLTIQKLDD